MGGRKPSRVRWALAACVLACLCLAVCAVAFGLVVPTWVSWESRSPACDLDGDGLEELVELSGRRVLVSDVDGQALYESDRGWRVSDALVSDMTGDGRPELVMLLWRRGNYGNSKPFWESGWDPRMTQHLYVMRLEEGALQPVWMGHELGAGLEVVRMEAPQDGRLTLTTRQGLVSTWEWDYFGFSLVEE